MLALRTVTYCTENEETPNRTMKLPIIGFLAITATASSLAANFDDYARVVNVQERYSNNAPVSSTRTVCEPVQQQAQSGVTVLGQRLARSLAASLVAR